ncbi:MCE family protein [Phycicoccus sp. DTK01]|uniref:MCE family protein n=1 Tax=Phycicoccus sp. DTK01 TaxID=2785745 RepID=UPI001A8D9587|nr:MlaD family protein [Phycicoccus sp. DTK01]GIL37422.1 ABC transporter substrate-binding protein [Phycicoccus sp. DTK01]
MIRRLTRVQLGLFLVITVVATSILSASYVGLTERVFGTGPTVVVDLASSGGIFEGAEVTYRGVRVGRVEDLTLSADGVRAHAKLESGVEVPTDTRAVVENRSAVGEQYLDLQPRADGAPYLADGDVIPRDDTATPLRVDQLLLDVDRTVRSVPKDDLSTVVDELGTGFEGTGDDLGRLIDGGDALTRSAIEALPDTVALLRSGKVVLDTQRDGASQIRTFSGNLARISETLRDSDPDLRVVLDRGAVASAELEAVVAENRTSLATLLANLVTVGQVTSARVDGIDQLLITYPEVVAGGYTVVPGDGTAHFGLQLSQSPGPCTQGYGGTTRTDPNRTSGLPKANTDARCSLPRGSASTVRGAQNAPGARPAGSATYAMAYGSEPVPLGTTAYGAPATVSAPVAPAAGGGLSWIMEEATR